MITPFIETKTVRDSQPVSGGIDTSQIDDLRQGVEIRTSKHQFSSGQPKVWAGRTDHVHEELNFGQKRSSNSTISFEDVDRLDAALYLRANGRLSLPLTIDDSTSLDDSVYDGTIEPLTIRRIVSFDTIDYPGDPHEVKATLMLANNDAYGNANIVSQTEEYLFTGSHSPYFDGVDSFGNASLNVTGNILLLGLTSHVLTKLGPFDDLKTIDTSGSFFNSGNLYYRPRTTPMIISSGAVNDNGLFKLGTRSKRAGFATDGNRLTPAGTDSIAFIGRAGSPQHQTLRLPARRQLAIRDSATGSYPTIARTGDTRTGAYTVNFDDTTTVAFTTCSNIAFPSMLPSGSRFAVAEQTTLFGTGQVVAGVSDDNMSFTPGEDITPYVEEFAPPSWYGIGSEDGFYHTGSRVEDVGEGFSSPLWSKTKIEIDLAPIASTTLSQSLVLSQSFPMAYFNFDKRVWEHVGIGTETSASFVDTAQLGREINEGMVGFRSMGVFNYYLKSPIINYGFPCHPKFHATSSQVLSMRHKIQHPFILEKMVYEYSASTTNESSVTHTKSYAPAHTFFILNQRSHFKFSTVIEERVTTDNSIAFYLSMSIPGLARLSMNAEPTLVSSIRDIVTFGQMVTFASDIFDDHFVNYASDLNIKSNESGSGGAWNLPPQILTMSASVVSPQKSNGLGYTNVGGKQILEKFDLGGRNGTGQSCGRDFGTSIGGLVPSGTTHTGAGGKIRYVGAAAFLPAINTTVNNPYVLLPTDNLIFGWQSPIITNASNHMQLSIGPDKGKLILYGSMLKNGREFHDTLNQPLTSNAIHEALHYDNPVVDQFDTEPRQCFSGSMTDAVMSGTMITLKNGSTTTGNRRSLDSRMNRNAGIYNIDIGYTASLPDMLKTGSFYRNMNLFSSDERYFDTVLPNPLDMINIVSPGMFATPSGDIPMGDYDVDGGGVVAERTWRAAFPFEPKFSSVNRSLTQKESITGQSLRALQYFPTKALYVESGDTSGYGINARNVAAVSFFGFGDGGVFNLVECMAYVTASTLGINPMPRGWKYGILNALPQYSKAVYRRDRYGQFRDRLEQSVDGKFLNGVFNPFFAENINLNKASSRTIVGSSPVNVTFIKNSFVVTPYETTDSSNLSFEATSSLPYFDEAARNR